MPWPEPLAQQCKAILSFALPRVIRQRGLFVPDACIEEWPPVALCDGCWWACNAALEAVGKT